MDEASVAEVSAQMVLTHFPDAFPEATVEIDDARLRRPLALILRPHRNASELRRGQLPQI